MKKILVILFLIVNFQNAIFSQEPTNPAAKQYYKGVLKHFEKLKSLEPSANLRLYKSEIDKSDEKIVLIGKSEQTYNVTSLQNELNGYKTKYESAFANQTKVVDDTNDLDVELNKLFNTPTTYEFYVDNGGIKNADNTYQQYVQFCSEFIVKNGKERVSSAKQANRYVHAEDLVVEMKGFNQRAQQIKSDLDNSVSEEGALANYYLGKKFITYWETAKTILPEEELFSSNYSLALKLVAEMGSIEQVKAKANANKKILLLKVQIPPAIRKDIGTENLFKQAFNAEGWNETILIVNLRDNDWQIVKNKNTGVIIGRTQTAAIASKNKNGECILYAFTIMQDYNGNSYQSIAHRSSHNADPMACENVR